MKTCISHYYVIKNKPTLIRLGVYIATTTRYFAKNKGTKQSLNDNTFQEMCLGSTVSLRYIPRGLRSGYGEVCVLQAESLRSWNDGGKHYYLNLRQPVHSPQVQEKINTHSFFGISKYREKKPPPVNSCRIC